MATTGDGQFDFEALQAVLSGAPDGSELYQVIVNAPFRFRAEAAFIFLGIVVLLLVNEEEGTIDRIALSDTAQADATLQVSAKPFKDIRIPLDHKRNLIAKVIRTGQPDGTSDWPALFAPALTAEQARINQANGGIGYSAVYPLTTAGGKKGAMIFSYYQYPEAIAAKQMEFMERYIKLVDERLRS